LKYSVGEIIFAVIFIRQLLSELKYPFFWGKNLVISMERVKSVLWGKFGLK